MIFTCCSAPASAALVALLFVAVSIGASFLTPEHSVATRTFMSPVVFHFSTLSHHQSHRDGAVPHRAIARDRHHARRRRLACLHDRGFWSALPVPRSAISPIGSVTEFYRWCLMSRCLPRRASSFRALHSRRYPGRSAAPSTRSQHPQCVGPDACFCAPGRHQELGYLIAARREQTARL
jgi:hypothetical protein